MPTVESRFAVGSSARRDVADVIPAVRIHRDAVDYDVAFRRREDAAEDREEGRLAAAGRTFERDDLAAIDREVDSFQHCHALAAFGEVFLDIGRFKNAHVLNTNAGSIDATLRNEIIAAARQRTIEPMKTAMESGVGITSFK